MNPATQTDWITLSERLYRALLVFYPAEYRHEYGDLMVQVFRDVCRESYRRQGAAGITLWWCRTFLDLILTVIEQQRKVKFVISKSTFVQMTGMLLIVGGGLSALAAFSQFQPGDHYRYDGIYQALILLFAPGSLLVGLGCIGLGLRYGRALGALGPWALYVSAVGSLVMAAGLAGMTIQASLWNVWYVGGIIHVAGLTAFGLLHARKPALPIFRWLPLQIASGWLIIWLGVLRTNQEATNNLLGFLFMVGIGLAWLAIGLTLNRQQRKAVLEMV